MPDYGFEYAPDERHVRKCAVRLAMRRALMKAARSGHLRIIEKLLECGAQHAVFDRHKMSALHHAARHGHAEAIRVLVRVGSKIDERDDRDWTPLMHAADQGHGKATAMLLEVGADVLAQTDTNNTALDFAWDHETRLALRLSAKRARIAEAEAVAAAEADAVAKMQREYEENEAAEAAVREALKSEGFIDKLKEIPNLHFFKPEPASASAALSPAGWSEPAVWMLSNLCH